MLTHVNEPNINQLASGAAQPCKPLTPRAALTPQARGAVRTGQNPIDQQKEALKTQGLGVISPTTWRGMRPIKHENVI